MSETRDPRCRAGGSSIRLSVAAVWMFVISGFIVPGICGAVRGAPLPVPWSDDSWGSWIVFWCAVSAGTYGITTAIFRTLRRRGGDR